MSAEIAIRQATDSDRRWVISSWLDSYRTAHTAGLIAMSRWKAVMTPELESILDRPGCAVLVAYTPGDDPDTDGLGWLCHEGHAPPLLHYVYVKQPYRRLGIAGTLLRRAGIDPARTLLYSCKTPVVSRLHLPLARFNPLIARFSPTE